MAGIYIHIPFCKKRCTYCDFYTEVAPHLTPYLIKSIIKELHLRKNYLKNEPIRTIYFGGGTPSTLSTEQFKIIFDAIFELFVVTNDAEITFEANPDDLSVLYLKAIAQLPFNRISIGIQSFNNDDLKRINRRHTGIQAIEAVLNAQNAGFTNISIDLIYGLPFQTLDAWEEQLNQAFDLNIQHLSAYGLGYEKGTVLWKQRENNEIDETDDETMNQMYDLLRSKSLECGFEAYEISNFSLPGFRSWHNTSYWQQLPYLGIGPSAHSYDIDSRQWNIASIKDYIDALDNHGAFFETETLSLYDRYNDYVMTALRTLEGIDLIVLEQKFGAELTEYCIKNSQSYINNQKISFTDGKLRLTKAGIQLSNLILTDLMRV